MDVFLQIVTVAVSALVGAWGGARFAVDRFARERAFERRVDWYDRTLAALGALRSAIATIPMQQIFGSGGDLETAKQSVDHPFDEFTRCVGQAAVYATPAADRFLQDLHERLQKAKLEMWVKDSGGIALSENVGRQEKMIVEAQETIAADFRRLLRLEPLPQPAVQPVR